MPAVTIEQSLKYREQVKDALENGADTPSLIREWIDDRKNNPGDPTPSLPTVIKILKELGYQPTGPRWEKAGE